MKLSAFCLLVSIGLHALLVVWARPFDPIHATTPAVVPAFEVVTLDERFDETETSADLARADAQDAQEVDVGNRATNVAAPGAPEPPTEPPAEPDESEAPPARTPAENRPANVGVEDLPLPPAAFADNARPVLVLDHRIAGFERTAVALGFSFIVFEDLENPRRYFELSGADLRTRRIRTAIDKTRYSTRAFDFTHVPRYRTLRLELAERCFIEPSRCRFAAVVPHDVRRTFAAEEARALRQLEAEPRRVRALFGTLRDDPNAPLRVTAAMLADGRYVPIPSPATDRTR